MDCHIPGLIDIIVEDKEENRMHLMIQAYYRQVLSLIYLLLSNPRYSFYIRNTYKKYERKQICHRHYAPCYSNYKKHSPKQTGKVGMCA